LLLPGEKIADPFDNSYNDENDEDTVEDPMEEDDETKIDETDEQNQPQQK